MGAVCDNAPVHRFPELEEPDRAPKSRYVECEWVGDSYFQEKIE